ncbi:MAG: CBS domain-containing protein [Anaerolineae bacterium]|nr:CBS domain-containing protein [Anaerolineae bacterium]
MKLILTHENADFDAVAAQLAAYKLQPDAVPVLPRRVNHNVREFLNLYSTVLPHVEVRDLPRAEVESVTVVDTQSVLTVKGMRPRTPAHIIDHHPPNDPLPEHHTFSGEQVGATTTLLVEQIHEQKLALTPIEATLLMLGIYEDTGSLLYGTTKARDIAAASWLVQQGADLDVVRRFLQHPLNEEQLELYDILLKNADVIEIQGHPIAITQAVLPENLDQISTVAHKLRELLEPSALFMLVQMGGRLQVVARSTVDEIDVGLIAGKMGGGGHRRAAAALVEGADLAAVRAQLEQLLHELVQPSVVVADLMSQGMVRTVSADIPVQQIAREMQRSGHEGYPVMAEGEIVGLLTRHAVDRAMAHRLGMMPVAQVMESGRVTVRPGDSIRHVQQQMMRSGWGQIPVVDDNGVLMGIVTRTDLIKQWGQPENGLSRRHEIIQRLESAFSPGLLALIRAVSAQARAVDVGLYCVGGFVRDLLLNRPTTDIDLVVEGDAIGLVERLVQHCGGTMRKHLRFGTATWILDQGVADRFGSAPDWPETLDFVTARNEFYENPSALPTVEQGSIKLDLHRRDFSINTLAIRLAPDPFGQLLDFWGGERDLHAGRIRVLHSLSFIDDPTRILRAARFEQRFGFHIEDRTLGLIEPAVPLLERITGPRLRHELELILAEEHPEAVLGRLQTLGVLRALHPDLHVDGWLHVAFEAVRQFRRKPRWPQVHDDLDREDWTLALFVVLCCRLEVDDARSLCRRLQVRRKTLDEVLAGVATFQRRLPALATEQRPSAVVRQLEPLSALGLTVAWVIAPTHLARTQIARYVQEWQAIRQATSGDDLRAMGIPVGPVYGRILSHLRDAWLDGVIQSPEDERALLESLVTEELGDEAEG